jgi:hypothetical protein
MKTFMARLIALVASIVLAGCAGTEFARVPDDALVLGQTTPEQITARLGAPKTEATVTKNDEQLSGKTYVWSSLEEEGAGHNVVPARVQTFFFHKSRLVAYEFTSSWKQDSTDFDAGKVPQIRKGASTRADVTRLLGNPGGKYIYPAIRNQDEEAVSYLYVQTKAAPFSMPKNYHKLLLITFNKQGTVTNVELSEVGEK